MIATFLFRVCGDATCRYGKYIGPYPLNYAEGLDRELVRLLLPAFRQGFGVEKEEDVFLAVLYMDRHPTDYYSPSEANVLDILYCRWSDDRVELHLHGNEVALRDKETV